MEEIRLALLTSEINAQVRVIDEIYVKIEERKKGIKENQERLESLAYQLHNPILRLRGSI